MDTGTDTEPGGAGAAGGDLPASAAQEQTGGGQGGPFLAPGGHHLPAPPLLGTHIDINYTNAYV